ncbi:hypothetical protein PINS_up020244 [Pythium insidiosum]|nr:hypothetical protein PINS_up020244 [Pythium insidiosum]
MAETAYLEWSEKRIEAAGNLLKKTADSMAGLAVALKRKNVFDVNTEDLLTQLDKEAANRRQRRVPCITNTYCDAIKFAIQQRTPTGAKLISEALQVCAETETLLGQLSARYVDALSEMGDAGAALARRASSGVRCNKAKEAKSWAESGKRRRLQQAGSDPNEPFYAMTYVPLTRLMWEYRIQEAAFQFCKFYEFKNGGVAPPMCGKNKYYTLEQIQEMRSWRPPVLKRINMRVLIPTRPEFNAEQMPVLPKYKWLFSNVDEKNVPSVYVESMRLYMPFDPATAADDGALPPLDVNVNIEPLMDQRVSWGQRDRVYMLPRQTFRFESSMGEQFLLAGKPRQQSDDGSSELCLRERGTSPTQNDAGLAADNTTLGATETTSPELNLIADLTVIQVYPEGSRANEIESSTVNRVPREAASTCCADGEYRVSRNKCEKCPEGTQRVLFGVLVRSCGRYYSVGRRERTDRQPWS